MLFHSLTPAFNGKKPSQCANFKQKKIACTHREPLNNFKNVNKKLRKLSTSPRGFDD